jgi:hypothetical protein
MTADALRAVEMAAALLITFMLGLVVGWIEARRRP